MNDPDNSGGLRNTIYKQETRSSRRMTPLRLFTYRCIVPIGLGLVGFFWRTCRVVKVLGTEHLDAALAKTSGSNATVIPVYWHQHQLFCIRWLLAQKQLKVGWLISPSVDGELAAMMVRKVQGYVIRGSSTATGARALRDYYDALTKQGVSPIITPDGPRGPRFEFKPGAILLSQMSGRPILPMAYYARRAILFHWDKFVIPMPFTRIVIAVGEPVIVPRILNAEALAKYQLALKKQLHALFHEAQAQGS
jgi:lysophospholipid acyltransferase (LPLAT)-like uncharacterized protein